MASNPTSTEIQALWKNLFYDWTGTPDETAADYALPIAHQMAKALADDTVDGAPLIIVNDSGVTAYD